MSTGKSRERNRDKGWLMLFVLLWTVMFGFLGGCSQEMRTETEADERTVTNLRVIYSSGDIRWTGSVEWVAEQFMQRYPDIQVTLLEPADVAGQSFTDRLKALIAEDEFYDVTELREDVQFSEAGYLAPLPDRLTSLIEMEKQGEVYAIPRYTTVFGMIYNRDLFESLGLSEPETYEEFLDICRAIRQTGVSPVAVGGADIWHMGFWGNYLYQEYILDECENGQWSRERIREMLRAFRDLSRAGYVEPRFANVSDSQTVHELSSSASAMVYSGPWILDQVTGLNPQMNLGFFYLPGRDGKARAVVDRSVTWGISTECREDEARWQAAVSFLEFFYSEGVYEQVLAQMNAEPVTVREILDAGTQAQKMVREAGEKPVVFCDRLVGDRDTPDGFRSFYNQCLKEVLWDRRSLEEIACDLEKRWRKND